MLHALGTGGTRVEGRTRLTHGSVGGSTVAASVAVVCAVAMTQLCRVGRFCGRRPPASPRSVSPLRGGAAATAAPRARAPGPRLAPLPSPQQASRSEPRECRRPRRRTSRIRASRRSDRRTPPAAPDDRARRRDRESGSWDAAYEWARAARLGLSHRAGSHARIDGWIQGRREAERKCTGAGPAIAQTTPARNAPTPDFPLTRAHRPERDQSGSTSGVEERAIARSPQADAIALAGNPQARPLPAPGVPQHRGLLRASDARRALTPSGSRRPAP